MGKSFCSFVDYAKVFEKKMVEISCPLSGVDCQMLNIIKFMYANIKSCVEYKKTRCLSYQLSEGPDVV